MVKKIKNESKPVNVQYQNAERDNKRTKELANVFHSFLDKNISNQNSDSINKKK